MRAATSFVAALALLLAPLVSASPANAQANGYELLFTKSADGDPSVIRSDIDGSDQNEIVNGGGPRWNPDGHRFAFDRREANQDTETIFTARPDGSDQRPLMDADETVAIAEWSPDGRTLAFWKGGEDGRIWVVNADGTGARAITDPPAGAYDMRPSWAPGRDSIMFERHAPRDPPYQDYVTDEIWIVDLSDGSERKLTEGRRPGWSPTGQYIAFVGYESGTGIIRPDGGAARKISDHGSFELAWSPDGGHLAIAEGTGTYVVDVASGEERKVSPPEQTEKESSSVDWSPDGAWVAFDLAGQDYQDPDDGYGYTMTDVYIARPDGSDRQKLTNSNEDAHYLGPQFRPVPTVRLAGETRIQTAVDISRHSADESDAVVLARHDLYPDALSAAPLATKHDAPLLLTPTGYVHDAVAEEIQRLGATTAHLMGSEAALDKNVERDLRELGIDTIDRYSGANRFDTARLAAGQTPAQHVYLTLGHDHASASGWADAVSIAGLAAHQQRPILLTAHDRIPQATQQALDDLNVTDVTIVGGPAAVSEDVAEALRSQGRSVDRIAGDNRYLTATEVADAAVQAGMDPSWTWFATGRNWPDSLAAGPAVAGSGGILLLVDGLDPAPDSPAMNWYETNGGTPQQLPLLGGADVLDAQLNRVIANAIIG